MHPDTPPPDSDALSDGIPASIDDIEIIEEFEIEDLTSGLDDTLEGPYNEAKLTYVKHDGPVFCVDLDKTDRFVVTGGQDDKALVWDSQTGETLFECKNHRDSVFNVGFNHDSKYVATADMGGLIQVWNVQDNGATVSECDVLADLRFIDWNNSCDAVFAGAADGNCWLWHFLTHKQDVYVGRNVPCSIGKVIPTGLQALVGYDDGSLQILDLKTRKNLHTIAGPTSHKGSVTAVDCHTDSVLAITGSVDGTAKVIKLTDGKVLSTLRCEPEDSDSMSVESVGFFSSQPLVATGTVNGSLAIWDIPTQVRRMQIEQEGGITKLFCMSSGPTVYTGGVDGVIRLMDVRTGVEVNVWGHHAAPIHDFAVSSDGLTIVTCSDDGTSKVFDTRST